MTARHLPRRSQQGVAAIEFAFVLLTLVLALYGIATFGTVFYTQQVLARAAEDGVRVSRILPELATVSGAGSATPAALAAAQDRVSDAVIDSLTRSLIVPGTHATDATTRRNWVSSQVSVTVTVPQPATSVSVVVAYPYASSGVFPHIPLLDASTWIPEELRSHARIAVAPI